MTDIVRIRTNNKDTSVGIPKEYHLIFEKSSHATVEKVNDGLLYKPIKK